MDNTDEIFQLDQRIGQILTYFEHGIDKTKASTLLNSLLTSHGVLTWNSLGELK